MVLTASVNKSVGGKITLGTVNFCDATATYCEDGHLLGSSQVTSKGTAVFKFRPAAGEHSYKAVFHGTTAYATSASSAESLAVTGGPFTTATTIAQSGSTVNYTLNATVTSSSGSAFAPSGMVGFLDTSNTNYELSSAALTPGPSILSYAAPVGAGASSGTQPMFSVTADFNQDGIPDIAVIDFNNPNIYTADSAIDIYFGNADGTFTLQSTIDTSVTGATAIVAGDLNGDGYPDLVVDCDGALNVFLNNGSGGFGAPATYNLTYTDYAGNLATQDPSAVAIGDVNNDGHLDVVFVFGTFDSESNSPSTSPTINGYFPGEIGVAIGNGDGSLKFNGTPPFVPVYGTAVSNSDSIVLTDLTGSGTLDIITGSGAYPYLSVLAGNGDGTFQNATNATSFYTNPAESQNIVVADFNGDGKPDLAITSSNVGMVSILLGNGDRTFNTTLIDNTYLALTYMAGNGTTGLVTADLNGDGIPDLATANNQDNTVTVMLGNGDGTFLAPLVLSTDNNTNSQTALTFPAGNGPYSIQAGNFTGSGVPSLVVVDENSNELSTLVGSVATTATATATGVSPVGPATATHAVDASYDGDAYYAGSISGTTLLAGQPVTTALTLGSNTSSITVGGQVTLTATLFPDSAQNYSASGTVTFYLNGSSFGSAPVSNGVAILKPHLEVVQTDSFTASYGGDGNFVSSNTTTPAIVGVQKAATTLTLQVCIFGSTCPASNSVYGQAIQVTASLAPYNVSGGPTTDGETITFLDNGNIVGTETLTDGSTTFPIAEPVAGNHSFTATYSGDASFIGSSTSSPSSLTVQKSTSSMSLTTSPVGTSSYGQQVVLTATFGPYTGSSYTVDGETVTFYNGANPVGTAMINGLVANLRLNDLAVGSYSFTVSYPGDSNFVSSSSTAASFSVQQLTTGLVVAPSPSGATVYGNSITLQAYLVPANIPGGNSTNGESITFLQNGTSVGSGTLTNGTAMFTVNVPPVGDDSYTASYAGDASFAASKASAAVVSVQKAPTSMGIATSAPNGIGATGQPVTLTATLAPYAQTGGATTDGETVTFLSSGNNIGTGTLANGVATLIVNGLAAGNYSFTASYPGDTSFNSANTTSPIGLEVLQSTTLTLTTSPANFAALNQAISLTATLSPYSSGSDSTNGELVIFYNGNDNIGNAPLLNGVATFNIAYGLPLGSYSFTALYQGDSALAGTTTAATPLAFSVATVQNFVVDVNWDDSGAASNCTPQSSTTSNTTDYTCSLRDALLAAANSPEGANITFDVNAFPGPSTISLTNGTLTVPSNTTIAGPTLYNGPRLFNLVTVDGGGTSIYQTSSTVFTVTGTGTAISNLTVSGGWTPWNGGVPGNGGGILNSGGLTLTNSTVTNNGTYFNGGGAYNTGALTVIGCTFAGNTAAANAPGNGGGIDNGGGTLTVINSTFANNGTQNGWGGGIAVDAGTATVTNSTLSANTASGGGGGIADVLLNPSDQVVSGGTVTLANSIVSENNDFLSDIDGAYTDQGGNVVGYFNRVRVDNPNILALAPLGNYGGPTQTMLPLPGSSAICSGALANSPSQWQPQSVQIDIDQRGYPNYNIDYSQLPFSNLPSVCFDAGAVQTNYYAVQFYQSSYTGVAGGSVNPTVMVGVGENAAARGGVPVTLSYSVPGTLSGNVATTIQGGGPASFSNLSVNSVSSGTLSTTIIVAGTARLTASAGLTVVAAAPPVGWTPSAVDSVTGSTTVGQSDSVLVTGRVADPQDGSPMSNVQVYIDGNPAGTPTLGLSSPSFAASMNNPAYGHATFTLSYPAASLSVGTHAVTVVATDSLGLSTTFGPTSFTVAASAGPGHPVGWTPSAVDSVTGSTTVGQSDSVVVTGRVADPQDGSPMTNVQVYIDGNPAGTPTLGLSSPSFAASMNNPAYGHATFTLIHPAASLSVGTHAVTVVATDSLGLSTTFGPTSFTVATSPPGHPVGWTPSAVDSVTGSTTVGQSDSVLVTGRVADPQDGSPMSNVQVYIDGNPAGAPTLGLPSPSFAAAMDNPAYGHATFTLNYSAALLSTGTHAVTVVATDSLGLSTTFGPTSFMVAASAGPGHPVGWQPTAVDSVTGSTTVGQSDSVLVTGRVADPQDGSPMSNVQVYIDGKPVGTPTLGLPSPSFAASLNNPAYGHATFTLNYPAASLSVGTHAVTVVATDSLGLSTKFGPTSFTVQ